MRLTITTWNINSVRLRIDGVARFVKAVRPDVLCLQETKCPDDKFPLKRFKRLGYEHVALNGQKGYHGVVVLSRLPLDSFHVHSFCGKSDCRHVSAVLGERAGLRDPITVHNLYVPAGGRSPRPGRLIRSSRTCRQGIWFPADTGRRAELPSRIWRRHRCAGAPN